MAVNDYLDEDNNTWANLTDAQRYPSIVLSALSFISLLISIPTVVLATYEYVIKNRLSKLRTERITMHLVYGSTGLSLLGCFQWIGLLMALKSGLNSTDHDHSSYNALKSSCSALGYLSLLLVMFIYIMSLCMGIHLLLQIINPKIIQQVSDKKRSLARKLEAIYLGVSITLALLLTFWPWFYNAYGYNKRICWIITINANQHIIEAKKDSDIALHYVINVILGITCIFSMLVIVIIRIILCRSGERKTKIELFIWAYTILIVIAFINVAIRLIPKSKLQSKRNLQFAVYIIRVVALGFVPLTASTAAMISINYKKHLDNNKIYQRFVNRNSKKKGPPHPNNYQSINQVATAAKSKTTPRPSPIDPKPSPLINDPKSRTGSKQTSLSGSKQTSSSAVTHWEPPRTSIVNIEEAELLYNPVAEESEPEEEGNN